MLHNLLYFGTFDQNGADMRRFRVSVFCGIVRYSIIRLDIWDDRDIGELIVVYT